MVQLTKYANKGGCACKIGPHILDQVLKQVRSVTNDNVMVDMTGSDDAGIYLINDEMALVQTLDFFPLSWMNLHCLVKLRRLIV